MYQLATAPRGIGQVLDSVFQLTRTASLRMLPYAILTTPDERRAVRLPAQLRGRARRSRRSRPRFVFSGGYWLTVLVMIAVSMLLYGASIVRIESIAQGADVGIGRRSARPCRGSSR